MNSSMSYAKIGLNINTKTILQMKWLLYITIKLRDHGNMLKMIKTRLMEQP